ncbi:MAG: TIGR00701 family protein [Micavibrio sp.]|nr:TIGR00701 family protein [Micavibrio sp.]
MQDFIMNNYNWFKAFHIIAVMAWMAGMLYLPRLFVYHADAKKGSDLSETLKIMERRLLKFIMNPAMIITWILGLLILWANWEFIMSSGWMHAKLTLVFILSGVHGMFSKWRKAFERDGNVKSAKFFRIWNEAPTVIMILVIVLAVVEPF